MVDTGTRAALAAAMASSSDRPVVLFPSDSNTMRAAGALAWSAALWPWLWFGSAEGVLPAGRAARAVKIASPNAVPGLVASRSRATWTAAWSVLGATTTAGVALALTTPTEKVDGRSAMNDLAAATAAASRLGAT